MNELFDDTQCPLVHSHHGLCMERQKCCNKQEQILHKTSDNDCSSTPFVFDQEGTEEKPDNKSAPFHALAGSNYPK